MTAASRTLATLILRTASGEPPLGRDGAFFRDDQGEILDHDSPQHRSRLTQIGILALQDSQWISMTGFPPIFNVSGPRFDSRDHALRTAIAAVVRRGRQFGRNGEGQGLHWSEGKARSVIEWALSLKPEGIPREEASGTARKAPSTGCGTSDESQNVGIKSAPPQSDPIVAALLAAHCARKLFPAGHAFAMTNPVMAGEIKTVGTCSCGHAFIFAGGDTDRLDAAIEAHWQKFDHLPEKVDGRGQPINEINAEKRADESQCGNLEPARKRSRRRSLDTGDGPGLANAALPGPASSYASCVGDAGPNLSPTDAGGQSPASGPAPDLVPSSGAGEIQAAQICASFHEKVELPAKSGSDRSPMTRGLEVRSGGSQPNPSELDANAARQGVTAGETAASFSSLTSFSGIGSARETSAMLHPGVVDGPTTSLAGRDSGDSVERHATLSWDALPPDVRARAEADGTEDLLKAAIALAWRDEDARPSR